jgi:hypothetical protein
MYNLRADLLERGTESQFYSDRLAYWIFLIVPAQAIATKWLVRIKEFPHLARAASSVLIRSSNWRSNARIAEQKETARIAAGRVWRGSPSWARTGDLRINSLSQKCVKSSH